MINNPFLFNGSNALDLKLFVLVKSCKPLIIFLHSEGLATSDNMPLSILYDILEKRMMVNVTLLKTKIKDVVIKALLSVHSDILSEFKSVGSVHGPEETS